MRDAAKEKTKHVCKFLKDAWCLDKDVEFMETKSLNIDGARHHSMIFKLTHNTGVEFYLTLSV